MSPFKVAARLSEISRKINASSRPSVSAVRRELRGVLLAMTNGIDIDALADLLFPGVESRAQGFEGPDQNAAKGCQKMTREIAQAVQDASDGRVEIVLTPKMAGEGAWTVEADVSLDGRPVGSVNCVSVSLEDVRDGLASILS